MRPTILHQLHGYVKRAHEWRCRFPAASRPAGAALGLIVVLTCQLAAGVGAAERDGPSTSVPLQGNVSKFATGADSELNLPPKLLPQAPTLDSSSPTPFPLHADRFDGSATDTAPPRLGSQAAMTAPRPAPQFTLRATRIGGYTVDVNQIKSLAKYDLEIIIDRSLSMKRRDCPGGLSRWDWCAIQAQELAGALSPLVPSGMTISRFATDFDVHERASAQEVASVMQQRDFQFGTRLSEPLAARLNAYFQRHRPGDKPLMIAVITDGRPYPRPEPRMVRDVLVQYSQYMKDPGEVKVVFLQIGVSRLGEAYLLDLAANLTSYGARFPYVRTITFKELMAIGLARALVVAARQSG